MYPGRVAVLITGFEPFGPVRANPSEAIVRRLPDRIDGAPVRAAVLPVDSARIRGALEALYEAPPQVALHLGVARERPHLSLERVARNRLSFEIPDNAGRTIEGAPIVPGGPEVLRARLPEGAILEAWRALGVLGAPSEDAGLYLCNQAFYLALTLLPPAVPAGFVHVAPDETLRPDGPHIPLAAQTEAVVAAARVALASLGQERVA